MIGRPHAPFPGTHLLVFASWHWFVSRIEGGELSTRLVLAGLGTSGQAVLTCMVLGIAGLLTVPLAAVVSIVIAAGLLAAGGAWGRAGGGERRGRCFLREQAAAGPIRWGPAIRRGSWPGT